MIRMFSLGTAMLLCLSALSYPADAAIVEPPGLLGDAPTGVPPGIKGFALALERAQQGDVAGARAIIARQPDSAAAHELLGIALAKSGDLDGATAAFQAAVKINPKQYTALTKLGDVAMAQHRYADAKGWFDQSIAIAPDDRLAHQRLGYLAELAGDPKAAISHYEAGVNGAPQNPPGVRIDLANLYNQRGDYDKALALLAPYADADPPAPGIAATRAAALTATGHADEAEAALARAVATDPQAALGLARIQASRGDLAGAEATVAATQKRWPDDAEVAFQLGAVRGLQRDYAGAQAAFAAGLAVQPDNPALLRGAMQANAQGGDVDAALALGQRLSTSGDPRDLFLVAELQDRAGQKDKAEAGYRAVLDKAPQDVPALNNLAMLLLARGDAAAAADIARRAAEAAPDLAAVQDTLGQTLLAANDRQGATAAFRRAISLAPDRQDYRDRLQQAQAEP